MIAREKLDIARRQIELARIEYQELMAYEGTVMGSVGLTARYNAMGGGGSAISDHTAGIAMVQARVSERYLCKMRWLDVILDVYGRLMDKYSASLKIKPLMRAMHERSVALVLYGKVFRGWTMEKIGQSFEEYGLSKSRQSVSNLYKDAIVAVARLADERGLFGD